MEIFFPMLIRAGGGSCPRTIPVRNRVRWNLLRVPKHSGARRIPCACHHTFVAVPVRRNSSHMISESPFGNPCQVAGFLRDESIRFENVPTPTMSIRLTRFTFIVLLFLSVGGCSTHEGDRSGFRTSAGSASKQSGVEVSIIQSAPETARLVSVLRRRNSSGSREEFEVLTLPVIECRSGESVRYRLEGVPGKNDARFVHGKLLADQDGIGVSVACENAGGKLAVTYSVEFREHHDGSGTTQRTDGKQTF